VLSNWAAEDEGGEGAGGTDEDEDEVCAGIVADGAIAIYGNDGGVGGIWQKDSRSKMMSNTILSIFVYILSNLKSINDKRISSD
jgi:hypothetical protein